MYRISSKGVKFGSSVSKMRKSCVIGNPASNVEEMLEQLEWPTFQQLRHAAPLTMLYKITKMTSTCAMLRHDTPAKLWPQPEITSGFNAVLATGQNLSSPVV